MGTAQYGYVAKDAPKYKLEPKVVADNITTDGYTYEYVWEYKKPAEKEWSSLTDDKLASISAREGINAFSPYRVQVTVTATRKDNGKNVSKTVPYVSMGITRATLDADNTVVAVEGDGWTYGEAHSAFSLKSKNSTRQIPEEVQKSAIKYYIKKVGSDEEITEDTIFEVGKYTIYAITPQTENYDPVTAQSTEIEVKSAKLTTPTELTMAATENAPYGLATWKAVDGPKENAKSTESFITPSYTVVLYYKEEVNSTQVTKVKTYENLEEASVNIVDDMQKQGFYYYTVQAISDNDKNCADSELATSSVYAIFENIRATDEDGKNVLLDKNSKKIVDYDYDSRSITFVATEGRDYQWYKDGVAIDGATSATYTTTYVADSGSYACRLLKIVTEQNGQVGQEQEYWTSYVDLTIAPRKLTITSGDATKTYDGTALTKDSYEVKNLVDGQSYTGVVVSGTVTDVQYDANKAVTSVPNTVTGDALVIREKGVNGEEGVIVYNAAEAPAVGQNYDVEFVAGELKVNPRSISTDDEWHNPVAGIDVKPIPSEDYTGEAHEPKPVVTDSVTGKTLVEGKDYTLSYPVVGEGNHINAYSTDGKTHIGHIVQITGIGNYSGVLEPSYRINRINNTVTLTTDRSVPYGTAVTDPADSEVKRNGDGAVTFKYFADAACTQELTEKPAELGVYYVRADVATGMNYKAANSNVVPFAIYQVTGYEAKYDGEKHSGNVSIGGSTDATIYYSETEITKENLDTVEKTTTPLEYDGVKDHKVYYYIDLPGGIPVTGNFLVKITAAEQSATVSVQDTVYDGKTHEATATRTSGAGALTVTYYKVTGLNQKEELPQGTVPTDAGTYEVQVANAATNNFAAVGNAASDTFTISKRAITVTSKSDTFVFDNVDHRVEEIEVTEGSIAENEGIAGVTYDNSIRNVGTIKNTYQNFDIKKGDKSTLSNYDVTYETGDLTVTPRSEEKGATYEIELTVNGKTSQDNVFQWLTKEVTPKLVIRDTSITEDDGTTAYVIPANTYKLNPSNLTVSAKGEYTIQITLGENFEDTLEVRWSLTSDEELTDIVDSEVIVQGTLTVGVNIPKSVPDSEIISFTTDTVEGSLLTDQDKTDLGNGIDIIVYLEAKNINDTVPEEEKVEVEEILDEMVAEKWASVNNNTANYRLVQKSYYIDYSLFKKVGSNPTNRLRDSVTPIQITVDIPQELRSNSARASYEIVRVHVENGVMKVDTLPTTYSRRDQTLTFQSNLFSTYAILYTDLVDISKPAVDTTSAEDTYHFMRYLEYLNSLNPFAREEDIIKSPATGE